VIRALRTGAWCALLLCALAPIGAARAAPTLHATVLWARGERVYLAASDSAGVEPGTTLSFEYRGKTVATGEVTAVANGELITARLTGGSLQKVKKLDRVRVTASRPPIRPAPVLTIGYPSPDRPSLLFACDSMPLSPAGPGRLYRVDERAARAYRLVRNPDSAAAAPWPDTLRVRLFDDAADEEIALERGELDAAVFWPGEASTHIREAMRWSRETSGTHGRGVLAALAGSRIVTPGLTPGVPDLGPLELLNEVLFRGDLTPAGLSPQASAGALARLARVRFEVDRACPGWQVLQQYLNRGEGPPGAPPAAEVIRVAYLDAPAGAQDSSRPVWFFTVGCPVLSRPELRPYLSALGPDMLANLFDCATPGRE